MIFAYDEWDYSQGTIYIYLQSWTKKLSTIKIGHPFNNSLEAKPNVLLTINNSKILSNKHN
jgi:hypothetical protein